MNINIIIESKEFNQGVYGIRWRYHQDENNVYWYNFDDVVDMLALKWKVGCKLYDEFLYGNEKIMFEDCNNSHKTYEETRFISSSGFDRLLNHENERHKQVRSAKLRLECRELNDELIAEVDKLYSLSHSPLQDYEAIGNSINKLYQLDSVQHALGLESDKEELVNEWRESLYNDEVDEVIMKRKNEEVKIYKKNPNYNGQSTCPSWLRSIVK